MEESVKQNLDTLVERYPILKQCQDDIASAYNILEEAYANSLCVLGAYDSDRLVGIIRAVGDGQTIVFVQDIIVLPEYQRKGIGTKLLKAVMEKYKDVYQMELLTDNTEKTKAFYRSVGFTASDDMGCVAFIRI